MNISQLQYQGSKYKLYTGRYIDQMPQLLADGRRPATVEDVVVARNETFPELPQFFSSNPKELMTMGDIESRYGKNQANALFFWGNYFHTIDGFYNSGFILGSRSLRDANPASQLKDGALAAADLEGLLRNGASSQLCPIDIENMDKDIKGIFWSTPQQEKYSKWRSFMRGNESSLNPYIMEVMELAKVLGYIPAQTMEIHLPRTNDLMPVVVKSPLKGSSLYGQNPMDKSNARLLGIEISR